MFREAIIYLLLTVFVCVYVCVCMCVYKCAYVRTHACTRFITSLCFRLEIQWDLTIKVSHGTGQVT